LVLKNADVLDMKVIVQDLETGRYLSADGRWVADRTNARDFGTLLRAYHFAKDNTSKHFQVLLHSTDDEYCSCIIDGMGLASANAEAVVAGAKESTSMFREPATIRPRNFWTYSKRIKWSDNQCG
jgi:hypothetical protein